MAGVDRIMASSSNDARSEPLVEKTSSSKAPSIKKDTKKAIPKNDLIETHKVQQAPSANKASNKKVKPESQKFTKPSNKVLNDYDNEVKKIGPDYTKEQLKQIKEMNAAIAKVNSDKNEIKIWSMIGLSPKEIMKMGYRKKDLIDVGNCP
jgi:hypothetical protein